MKLPAALQAVFDHEETPHLVEALTHPSFANEQKHGARLDYQRLEFLGDAVLQLCVSEVLVARFPAAKEGELSALRSNIVNTEALASHARDIELGGVLRLGRGAAAAGEREQATVLADALEAVIGAAFLDRGLDAARTLAREIIERGLSAERPLRDAKSALQEVVQARGGAAPRYKLVSSGGADHQPAFEVSVEALGRELGRGRGRSKKAAEQEAAREALHVLRGED
ncbi:MAG: ribonuclease III [Polyangiaceae bacterium]